MKKRTGPLVIVGCVLLLAGLAGYLVPGPDEAVPSRLLMDNVGGRVVFTHGAHSTPGGAYGDSACSVCHHELATAPAAVRNAENPEVLGCKTCHGAAEDPDFIKKHQEFYSRNGGDEACARCHHTRFEGFSEQWSHKDHAENYVDECATCHHEAKFEYKPGKFLNVKPQKCSNCHTAQPNPMTAKTIKEAGHLRCESCHSDFFESGAKGCGVCHKSVSASEELAAAKQKSSDAKLDERFLVSCVTCHKAVVGSMDAYHGKCVACHEQAKRGPGGKDCQQCHTP